MWMCQCRQINGARSSGMAWLIDLFLSSTVASRSALDTIHEYGNDTASISAPVRISSSRHRCPPSTERSHVLEAGSIRMCCDLGEKNSADYLYTSIRTGCTTLSREPQPKSLSRDIFFSPSPPSSISISSFFPLFHLVKDFHSIRTSNTDMKFQLLALALTAFATLSTATNIEFEGEYIRTEKLSHDGRKCLEWEVGVETPGNRHHRSYIIPKCIKWRTAKEDWVGGQAHLPQPCAPTDVNIL